MTDLRNINNHYEDEFTSADCLAVIKAFALVAGAMFLFAWIWCALPGAKTVDDVLQIELVGDGSK